MENEFVPRHHIPMYTLNFSGLRGKGILHTLFGGLKLIYGFFQCLNLIRKQKPDVIIGMGGYVTVPGGLAAALIRTPLVLMNADASLLLSNKILAPFAQKIFFGLPPTTKETYCITGNPIRTEISTLPTPEERYPTREGPLHILILGGSLGATILNRTLPKALALLPANQRPIVTHQSGKKHIHDLKDAYQTAGVTASVIDFIEDISSQYEKTDIVICRAGAITVSELTAAGVASILVPLVVSTTHHQADNAHSMEQQGAAIHLPQSQLTAESLANLLQSLTREKCYTLAKVAYQLGKRQANEDIVALLDTLNKQYHET
jgi:UDP-N-acetylglucosamine--N-acetylmuramyl-(pentapeptide) pyrophosphoryl-undecaprenol N-acetylglucosamine transferase